MPTNARTVRRYGRTALLMECDTDQVPGLIVAADESTPVGITETVPGASSILARFDPRATDAGTVGAWLSSLEPASINETTGPLIWLDVVYDGPDIDEVAELCGISADQLIARHLASDFVVAFCGFAPGFAYLTGLDPTLHVPRRPAPRESVRAGSVALAAEYCAVYPRSSPGGWHLIGSCAAPLFVPDRDPPAMLTPGSRVKFRRADGDRARR